MSSLQSSREDFRSGFIALIGRPNVGKSTLVNKLVGKKVAITSPIAQTTRNRLRVILTTPKAQIIFVDAPGIHKPHHLLGERLVQSSKNLIGEVDSILLMFEGCKPPGRGDAFIVQLLAQQSIPVLIALNKWDLVSKDQAQNRLNEYRNLIEQHIWPIYCCSAVNGEGCEILTKNIINFLPFGPCLYPSNITSDQSEEIFLSELIREQVLLNTREEIPHSVAVSIDRIEEMPIKNKSSNIKRTAILATIFVEKKSQKSILIGKGGSMLKIIGKGARSQMKKIMNVPIYLELFVKVLPNWRSRSARLSELGYKAK
ncbi:GTPase Era [Prochlorococcus marinus]|uniref:GTPase Era n=1 Tax=Prochlorococcus marinus TaxID=1219 RepID=UPI0022B5A8E7|nr:GTPase Era [Prochlorococcus marinus]